MKRFLHIVLCLCLISALNSCTFNFNINLGDSKTEAAEETTYSDPTATQEQASTKEPSATEDTTTKETEPTTDSKTEETKPATDSKTEETEPATDSRTEETEPVTESEPELVIPDSLTHVNNGVLRDASPEAMRLPYNMELLGSDDVEEENNAAMMQAAVVLYSLDGVIVNWATENDLIYVITEGNNRLVVIDAQSMTPISNTPLPGVPAEMNIIGDEIYISLPALCRIDVFSKYTSEKLTSLYFDHEVSSFCLDGSIVYYTEHDQWCRVFKKDLETGAEIQINDGSLYYFPKIYLNAEDRILYIGESNSTGSAIFCYDADTLQLLSFFRKNDYGIMNYTREIFHVGDEIFWGNFRLSDTNAKELVGRYGVFDDGSVVFASEEMVSTYEGLFLTDTYECVINYAESGFNFEYVLVSESYHVFFRQRFSDQNVIIGVNFHLQ